MTIDIKKLPKGTYVIRKIENGITKTACNVNGPNGDTGWLQNPMLVGSQKEYPSEDAARAAIPTIIDIIG